MFWFSARYGPWRAAGGGVLWITLVTVLAQNWLLSFHPLAFPITLAFQIPWYGAVFAVSSLLWRLPGGVWLQALLWTAFEYLRIQGFFAFPYGAVASAFWAYPVTFQSADLVGTSGVTLLLAATAAWLARGRFAWRELAVLLALWAADLGYGAWHLS